MPLTRISHVAGKPPEYRAAISRAVQEALEKTFAVVPQDRFQIITEHEPVTELIRPKEFLGLTYTDEMVFIQITCNDWRTVEHKKELYATIADKLVVDPGIRREDIIISILEVRKENWSFGNGVASFAE